MQLTQGLKWSRRVVPNRIATHYAGRTCTWESLADRVARLASGLQRCGVGPGDRVALLALNSDHFIEALYAICWAGAVPVPFNTRWAKAEIESALIDSAPTMIMIDQQFRSFVPDFTAHGVAVVFLDDEQETHSLEGLIASSEAIADQCGRGDDLAAIFFTGGTTGRNKGVMLSHINLVSSALMFEACAPYGDNTCFLNAAPLFHLAAAISLFGVTMVGGTHVFLPGFEPSAVLRTIEQYRVTALIMVPTMIAMLCESLRALNADVSSVRRITYGGSAISAATLEHAIQHFPNAQFVQAYGQTESSPIITVLVHADHLAGKLNSAGRPLTLVEAQIVDSGMRPLMPGEVGEVVTRGPNVMLGYWGLPELTSQTIVDGWLRTGDAGYMDENGYLYLVDRIKDMIVSGGENVYSAEVEAVLMRHAQVVQCAVIGVPDERWGERVHAVIQLREDADLDMEELDRHCRQYIAGYKCPKSYDFSIKSMPISNTGKILKSELRKSFWNDSNRNIS
jgi:long-chain acyl-CoA synthetase